MSEDPLKLNATHDFCLGLVAHDELRYMNGLGVLIALTLVHISRQSRSVALNWWHNRGDAPE